MPRRTWLSAITMKTIALLAALAFGPSVAFGTFDPSDDSSQNWPQWRGPNQDGVSTATSLPVEARKIFVLHDIEGYRHKEISELTGKSVGTCKSQLHRARKLLREALES